LAQARKILARSKAIKSIATVTRTMEMVATARFKQAYNRCVSARKYIDGVGELLGQVVARAGEGALDQALLTARNQASPQVVIVITSDRGLCSGYNLALLKLTTDRLKELQASGTDIRLHVAGKKGILHLQKAGVPLAETYSDFAGGMPSWRWTSHLADSLVGEQTAGNIRGVNIIYAKLIGSGRFEPTVLPLLPISTDAMDDQQEKSQAQKETKQPAGGKLGKYEFEPSAEVLLARLVPAAIRLRLYQCFMEAAVTEQIARMAAMHAASQSADDMIQSLRVKYNRTRQAQITTELAEILGGQGGND